MIFSELQSASNCACLLCKRPKTEGAMIDSVLIVRGENQRNVGGVGFVVHPSVIHVVDSYEILSRHLAILCFCPLRGNPESSSTAARQHHRIRKVDKSEVDSGFMGSWKK
ncbi:hypothetical protein RB195_024227 [Necator americanus]|uniref:Uncharacterized protein n=1 Tax=Necator americanus TaxID=51031 RepID=A0ABR1EMB4_NECAM